MKLNTLTGLAAILALTGCASHRASAPPSALGRAPVSSDAIVSAYQAALPLPSPAVGETRVERQVNDLSRQVGELKAYLFMLQANQDQGLVSVGDTRFSQGSPMDKSQVVNAPSLKMTIDHEMGASKFSLSDDETASFVAAAKASGHITIRGRSDGNRLTPQAKALAIDRAMRVKAFLMSQGVSGDAIRITYCTYGCQVADGATSEGRRLNRQTVVELHVPAVPSVPVQASRE